MSVDVTMGHAPLSLRVLREFSTCGGRGLVVAKHAASGEEQGDSGGQAARLLAALLGEREALGHEYETVSIQVRGSGSFAWLAEVISWLGAQGRRAIIRTTRVLPKAVIEAARVDGATVVLQVASFDVDVQRALLGPDADAAARLLLCAQHLHALQVPVAVAFGPLLPVLHGDAAIAQVARHIAAADLHDVSLAIGAWNPSRQAALESVLPSSTVAAIARAFGVFDAIGAAWPSERGRGHGDANGAANDEVSAGARGRTRTRTASTSTRTSARTRTRTRTRTTARSVGATAAIENVAPRRLEHREAVLLHARARRITTDVGLRVDECGCNAHCQLAPPPPQPFRSLLAGDLFAGVG